jgi:uncharacterized membrane protein YGL010W
MCSVLSLLIHLILLPFSIFYLTLNPSPRREGLNYMNIILMHPFALGRRGWGMR